MSRHNHQAGFTVLELMIATMVFSAVFLGATTALIQISHLYFRGVTAGRTQEVSRGVTDQISQQLQFSGAKVVGPVTTAKTIAGGTDAGGKLNISAICIGATRYTYRINAQVDPTVTVGTYGGTATNKLQHALWRDSVTPGTCPTPTLDLSQQAPSVYGEEVLARGMRLSQFSIACSVASGRNLCTVNVGVVSGDNDLVHFDMSGNPGCNSVAGDQWCAISSFQSTVLSRVGG